MRTLVFLCLTLFCLNSGADVYKTIDADGNVSYSYSPSNNGNNSEKINIKPTNIVPAGKAISLNRPPKPTEAAPANTSKYSVKIISPAHEFNVPPGQRDLIIAVGLKPALKNGDKIRYYMNDTLLGENTYNNFSITEITRGEHQLHANVIDPQGNTVGTSSRVTVFVHRVSIAR